MSGAKHGTWVEGFIKKLIETRSVTKACQSVGINRSTAYDRREKDSDFKERWDEAVQICIDDLEASAMRRAIEGNAKPLLYKGQPVMVEGADGKLQPLIVREYETGLTIFMLKAMRPKKFFLEKQLEMGDSVASQNAQKIRAALMQIETMVPENSVELGDATS